MKKALETPIAFPAEMAFGLILKASKEPKNVICNVYQRVEEELRRVRENEACDFAEVKTLEAVETEWVDVLTLNKLNAKDK